MSIPGAAPLSSDEPPACRQLCPARSWRQPNRNDRQTREKSCGNGVRPRNTPLRTTKMCHLDYGRGTAPDLKLSLSLLGVPPPPPRPCPAGRDLVLSVCQNRRSVAFGGRRRRHPTAIGTASRSARDAPIAATHPLYPSEFEDGVEPAVHTDQCPHLPDRQEGAVDIWARTAAGIVTDRESLVGHSEHDFCADDVSGQTNGVDLRPVQGRASGLARPNRSIDRHRL